MRKALLIICTLLVLASTGQDNLLICHTDPGQTSGVETYIAGNPEYDTVDIVDCRYYTPTVAEMEEYICVFVWTNYSLANPHIGDNLADYMDSWGSVVSCCLAHNSIGGWGICGRYTSDENYCPVTSGEENFTYTSLGDYEDYHDIMEGVESITDIYYWQSINKEGPAVWLADLSSGYICAAMNYDRNAVGINIYPGDYRH